MRDVKKNTDEDPSDNHSDYFLYEPPVNAEGLMASIWVKKDKTRIFFYGTEQNGEIVFNTVAIKEPGTDSTIYFRIKDNLVDCVYKKTSDDKFSPILYKFEYPIEDTVFLSILRYDWTADSGTLKYKSIVSMVDSPFTSSQMYGKPGESLGKSKTCKALEPIPQALSNEVGTLLSVGVGYLALAARLKPIAAAGLTIVAAVVRFSNPGTACAAEPDPLPTPRPKPPTTDPVPDPDLSSGYSCIDGNCQFVSSGA